jgi:hypothetical protein
MATDLQTKFSRSSAGALFKNTFEQYMEDVVNTRYPLLGRIKRITRGYGKHLEWAQMVGFQGGVGSSASGALPEANVGTVFNPRLESKRIYARALLDREAIYSSMDDAVAFVKSQKENMERAAQANAWNRARMLFGSGDAALGTIDSGGVTDNGGGNYDLVISTATWKEANFEENMFVNIETGNTDLFEVTTVDPDNRTVTVQRQSGGTQVPVATDEIFLQGSEDNDFHGLKEILDATSGTLYNQTVSRRWQAAYQKNLGRAITTDDINRAVLRIEKKVGAPPTDIVTSYEVFETILNLAEDQKRYTVTSASPRDKRLAASFSFKGVEFMTSRGPVMIYPDVFCDEDRMYLLNSDKIVDVLKPNSGWVDDDGTVYLRIADEDTLEARHATYGNTMIIPSWHGVITGISTPS